MKMKMKKRIPLHRLLGTGFAAAALILTPLALGARGASRAAVPKPLWMTQILWDHGVQHWTLATFQKFAREGITDVEINLSWLAIEPTPGTFTWSTLNTYLKYCAETHLHLVPIFWEYGAGNNPPYWLPGGSEITSAGLPAQEPAFWSKRAFTDYATFIRKTLLDVNQSPGFGGAYIDYGWLDAAYGPDGWAGYAPQDVAKFHQWLVGQYGSIAKFDQATGSTYATWDAVPAFTPGQTQFPIYQRFRLWSYKTLLGRLLAVARTVTKKPLFIYYGGGIADDGQLGNVPDNVFALAKQYHAAVNMDTDSHTSFAALFGFLSQSYGVPVVSEWTPEPGLPTELAQWLGQYPLEGSDRDGADYYLYGGSGNQPNFEPGTYPLYLQWHTPLSKVVGGQPHYRVGIMLGYDQLYTMDQGAGLPGDTSLLANYLRFDRPAANVFTDLSVLNGAVHLSQFKTIVDWNSDLQDPQLNPRLKAKLQAFEAHGGKIIAGPSAALPPASAPKATVREVDPPTNLIGNPSGAQGITGWHLGWPTGSTLGVTTVAGAPELQWSVNQALGHGDWVDYNPTVVKGQTYTYRVTLSGRGSVQLNFYNGTTNVEGKAVTLTKAPQTLAETVTIAKTPTNPPQVQVVTPVAETATVDIQNATVVPTSTKPPAAVSSSTASNGVTPVNVAYDGNFVVKSVLGRLALVSTPAAHNSPGDYCLYFQTAPSLVPATQSTVTIAVTYANDQANSFALDYDSTDASAPVDGAYDSTDPVGATKPVSVTDTGTYRTATFQVANAHFVGGENDRADFRILAQKVGLTVSSVSVTADGKTATYAPDAHPSSVPGPTATGLPSLPAQFTVSPIDPDVETFASVSPGKAFIVISNIGPKAYTGVVAIPRGMVSALLPQDTAGTVRSSDIFGAIHAQGSDHGARWDVSLPSGRIGIVEIHPE